MDPMSIANMSMSMAHSQTMSQVGMAVMDMALSSATEVAAGEVAMLEVLPAPAMEVSVNPSVGSSLDVSI